MEELYFRTVWKCTASQLKGFVHVRIYKKIGHVGYSWPKKKGTSQEAKNGDENLLKLAFDNRLLIITMSPPDDVMREIENRTAEVSEEQEPRPTIIILMSSPESNKPVSYLLNNTTWKRSFASIIKTNTFFKSLNKEKIKELEQAGNLLSTLLHSRLTEHLRRRVYDSSKHNHFSLLWSRDNISRFSASGESFF